MMVLTPVRETYYRIPVRNLNDLQGLEVRATGLSAKTLQQSRPRLLCPRPYEALSKGVVNDNLGPIEILQGWRQARVTKFITKTRSYI